MTIHIKKNKTNSSLQSHLETQGPLRAKILSEFTLALTK